MEQEKIIQLAANKIWFVKNRFETQRGIQLNDGRVISIYDKDNNF